jgi:hypothetical protein
MLLVLVAGSLAGDGLRGDDSEIEGKPLFLDILPDRVSGAEANGEIERNADILDMRGLLAVD